MPFMCLSSESGQERVGRRAARSFSCGLEPNGRAKVPAWFREPTGRGERRASVHFTPPDFILADPPLQRRRGRRGEYVEHSAPALWPAQRHQKQECTISNRIDV